MIVCQYHPVPIVMDADFLRTKSDDVTVFEPELYRNVVDQMIDTMFKMRGAGLSAIQVGVPLRIIVIKSQIHGVPMTFYNPKVVDRSGEQIRTEGCLSRPGWFARIKRSNKVTIEHGANGDRCSATGFMASVFQHEIDHLDGKLCWEKK